ncbi:hypothetical protein G3M58_46815, partial [Streptomyces sp. SID7499]|nr:hypothetical protein [Streptomyces sp. SID7499]
SRPVTLPTAPDGEGHLRVTRAETGSAAPGHGTGAPLSAHTPNHGGPGHGAPASPFPASAGSTAPPGPYGGSGAVGSTPDESSWPEQAEAGP